MTSLQQNDRMANAIRFLAMDAVEKANSGHPGMPMGMADVATVLFTKYLRFDPKKPHWPNRDRFVLSAGHGSMLLYSLLYLTGYPDMTVEDLKQFRQLGSKTAGHPEYGHATGIETTTGPLGQGIANAVGMAIAERKLREEFGAELQDHYTYVINGDGCLMEGISHEAIALAGHLKLNKLVLFWDNNSITIDGAVSLSDSTDQIARFKAVHWNTIEIDGHDQAAIAAAIEAAHNSDRPTFIACKTIIGFGAPNKQGSHKVHGNPLGAEEIAATRKALNWDYEPFVIPSDLLDEWRAAGTRSANIVKAWEETLAKSPAKAEFSRRFAGDLPEGFDKAIDDYKKKLAETKPTIASRKASEDALEVINGFVPETLGGSADLTPSNNTKTSQMHSITPTDFAGRYMHWGIREHGMASAMNGIALHGGLIPYGGGFLIFSDYCRPPIRLASLMGIRVIHVLTHDSIGVGEDGPTHQPVEHLASLRYIPHNDVWRPCDAVESATAWKAAIARLDGPSCLVFSRQNLPHQPRDAQQVAQIERGGYVLRDSEGTPDVILLATGSEVGLATQAADQLSAEGVKVRVVSMPSTDVFDRQPLDYRESVLPNAVRKRVAIEAGVSDFWRKYVGLDGDVVGIDRFGASAPAEALFPYFGFTVERVVATVKKLG